ncbi:hypothetical protein Cni_G15049 [Canna indica]|uniref:Protein kinase domain-containing protein n=1 Tax=Canna indica TaxID=4628 RepID=A0AAQ3KHB9_9LILI|nr:hypothetical protein Cni_G15049 [Canna indica]
MATAISPHNFVPAKPFHGRLRFASRARSIHNCRRGRRPPSIRSTLITEPDAFEVGRFIGSYGFMNITSYLSFQGGISSLNLYDEFSPGYTTDDIERLRVQDVGEGQVKIRLYEGRIVQGPRKGTRVIFKVYPGRKGGGVEADMMAANELSTHVYLQSDKENICPNLQFLLGAFETKTGEQFHLQWLAFRNDGKYSAADYGKLMSEGNTKDNAKGENVWNPFNKEQKIKRRRLFIIKLLNGAMNGLAYMHDHDRLHQSLGSSSIVLSTLEEKDAAYLIPTLRDLSFSVDIGYSSLEAAPSALSEELWRRASAAGAFTPLEKRAYGIADDIYEAGFLFAYLAFIPFCEAGIMDTISLQRLFENTFQLDLHAAREYCLADDRLSEAVKFLDIGDGSGWELLQAMLNPDYRRRPIAAAVLNHRFMTGAVL